MSVSWQEAPFAEGRRRRCDCCNRALYLADRITFMTGGTILGDLDLCAECASAIVAALRGKSPAADGYAEEL